MHGEIMNALEEFIALGNLASFHYADDTTKEWGRGDECKRQAIDVYKSHPELHEQMKHAAKEFLWTLDESDTEDSVDEESAWYEELNRGYAKDRA
jgi:hypothetical protein